MVPQVIFNYPLLYSLYLRARSSIIAQKTKDLMESLVPRSLRPPLPANIVIDSATVCNLACPLCPTGTRTTDVSRGMLTPDDFSLFTSQFPNLTSVWLYYLGEPLLNPKIFEILDRARRSHVAIDIDTNFSLRLDDAYLRRLIHSGLRTLRVSLDGASQATYGTYRKYGDFRLAFGNMKRLRALQKKLGAKTPKIYWKFLVTRHNESEIDKAKMLAQKIDVTLILDQFMLSEDVVDIRVVKDKTLAERKTYWLPQNRKYLSPYYLSAQQKPPFLHRPCPWLFSSLIILPDGMVLPCCYAASRLSAMGNLKTQSLSEIWYSKKYLYARSLFMKGSRVPRVPVLCERCPVYQKSTKSTLLV